ncbi:MAG TPA: thioredoxin family protein [Streptosporangiaceae bacterium]|nr:thioredoxin family protein [Streptosporangiaceae bacterium]
MTPGLVAAVVALALASGIGLWWRTRNGMVLASKPAAPARRGPAAPKPREPGQDATALPGLGAADLGSALGERATLVQFSSAFCAPCRATRRVLADVATMVDGVTHIEIDAESRLDLVRRLDVRRTPTTFVLGPDGHVTHRASGQPRKVDVIAALGAVIEFPI